MICLPDGESTIVGHDDPGAAVMIAESESAHEQVLMSKRARVGEVLEVDIKLEVCVHVEDALRGAASHCGEIPVAAACAGVDAIKGALRVAEAKVAYEALCNAIRLYPRECRVARRGLLAIEKLEAAEAQRAGFVDVIAEEAGLEGRCGRKLVVVVRGVVSASEPELALRCNG